MAALALRREEGLGLAVAAALHVALVAVLVLRPASVPVVMPPERIEVSIAEETGLTSSSPNPFEQAAADVAPELGEAQPEPAPAAPQPVVPEPPKAVTPPPPKAQPLPQPKPVAKAPAPKRVQKTPPKPQPKAAAKSIPAKSAPAKSAPAKSSPIDAIVRKSASTSASTAAKGTAKSAATATNATAKPATTKAGGSMVGADFLEGVKGAKSATGKGRPASSFSTTERASFAQAILRQVKPVWQGRVPEGVGTEKLVTVLSIELNPDGTLARRPTVVSQDGIDDSNRAQAARHAEEAIRAVQLAAPFNLPRDQYEGWKKLPPLRFRKSAQ